MAKLLSERGVAEMKHHQALRTLRTAAAADAPNRRIIKAGLEKVEQLYDLMLEKHVNYVLKLGAAINHADHQQWIDERGDNHAQAIIT